MGFLPGLILISINLISVAIDMMLILLFFHILGQWWSGGLIDRVTIASKDLVIHLVNTVTWPWYRLTTIPLSHRGKLALTVAILSLGQFVLLMITGHISFLS